MAGYIGNKAVGLNVTTGDILGDVGVGGDATIGGTALVTGVLTTTAATIFNGGFVSNDGSTITTADNTDTLTLQSTDADAVVGPVLSLKRDSSSPADNDALAYIKFVGENDAGEEVQYVYMQATALDVTDGTEDGKLEIVSQVAGAGVSRIKMDSTEIAFNDSSVDLDFRVESNGNTEMFIVNGGTNRVGIGANPDYFFKVTGSAANDYITVIDNQSSTAPYVMRLLTTNAASDNNTRHFLQATDSSTARFVVQSDGDVQNHDNSYGAISDQRVKQNISDATSQWDDIKGLRVRKFKLKDDVRDYGDDAKFKLGLVAQEAEIVSANLIKETPANRGDVLSSSEFGTLYEEGDTIPDGQRVGDVKEHTAPVKGIKYSILYMKAVKALQEAMTRIETLEAKVAVLEG